MKIRISFLTAFLIILSIVSENYRILTVYSVMTLHEFAHLLSAIMIGLVPERITFAPFGVNLKLKNKIVRSMADEIILYLSGPFINAALAIVFALFGNEEFYKMNIVVFVLNLLPIYPLDGGIILKKYLSERFGSAAAVKIIRINSAIISFIFVCLACIGIYMGKASYSMIVMSLFFLGNIITAREKYDSNFINAVDTYKKRTNKAQLVIVDDTASLLKATKSFNTSKTTIGAVLDDCGRIKELISEREILDRTTIN